MFILSCDGCRPASHVTWDKMEVTQNRASVTEGTQELRYDHYLWNQE